MLVGLCGSLRADSSNRKLMREAARLYGGAFSEADIRFPLYDNDLEDREGVPQAVESVSAEIKAAEAVLVVTPEYNQSFSGVLKNALDWISRTKGGPWRDKPVALLSAAAGRAGGARAQYALRLAMNPFRPRLLTGPEVLLANSRNQFDEAGRLTDERTLKALIELMEALRAAAMR
ncbi:MAG: NAD(P)H-dependent oxidoreductase [Paracoccaceae bacterium]|nr:NAD(P)H-dependent oxidoreductase [Paracoccaceae bacterium]